MFSLLYQLCCACRRLLTMPVIPKIRPGADPERIRYTVTDYEHQAERQTVPAEPVPPARLRRNRMIALITVLLLILIIISFVL